MRTALSSSIIAALAACLVGTPVLAASTYTVSAGDSLWAIAREQHTTVAALEAANHLTDSSVLQLGQVLVIPSSEPPNGVGPVHAGPATAVRRSHHGSGTALRRSHHRQQRGTQIAGSDDLAVARVLWAATHGGSTPLNLPGVMSYAAAARALAFETHITATAMRYLGVPYMWGGTSFYGVDCSGFVWSVFHRNGIDLPRMADEQFNATRHVGWHAMRPGDLVFFETYTSGVSHVGIYLGSGRFIHASSSEGVRIDSLGADYYASRFVGAGRAAR